NAQIAFGPYLLLEGWSGFALDRTGNSATPFLVPGLDGNGGTNLAGSAAIQFFFIPHWNSSSLAPGGGPEVYARLAELAAVSGGDAVVVWSLQVAPDGSSISLFAPGESGPAELLRANVAWQAETAHCLTLVYGESTALFVDGQLVATGTGTLI